MYHFPVHRFVAILLLLLVPLRIFGAEAFGIVMFEHHPSQMQAMDGMPDDCPMKQGGTQNPKDSGDCSGCQLCMSLVGPDSLPDASNGAPSATVLAAPRVQFRSADTRRTLRPPIA